MRRLLCAVLAVVLVLTMGVCAFAEDVDPELLNGEGIQIAFIISDLSNEIFSELVNACQVEAEALGATFTFAEAKEVSDKIAALENFTAAGVDVIVSHVTEPDTMQPYIEEAQAKGVKFIAYDTDTATSDMFFGSSNYELGKNVAKNAAKWINANFSPDETVKVGIANYPESPFLIVREDGIRDGLAEFCPNAEVVVAQQAGYVPEGIEVGEVWVQSNPDLNCICGIDDSGVVGIYQAFEAGGIDVSGSNNKLGMFGVDATSEAMTLISNDTVFRGTIALDLVSSAGLFMERAIILANGGEVEHDHYFDMALVDHDNYEEYMNHEGI